MAHALFGHEGLCRNIHGHTYSLSVTLIGPMIEASGKTDDGMVVDFSILKELVRKEVISVFDHSLVLNGNSPHRELKDLPQTFERVLFMDKQPTCENLVTWIAQKLKSSLPAGLVLHHVSLMETPTAKAEWHLEDNPD